MEEHQEELYRAVLLLLLKSPSDQDCQQDVVYLFHSLGHEKCLTFNLRHEMDLVQNLQDCSLLFDVRTMGERNFVAPRTSLTICRRHSNKGGSCPEGTCTDLHFCAFFLLCGECNFGSHCHFGHELKTPHNRRLLERHLLGGLLITELRTLFCLPAVRQGVTLPQVCRFYNINKGCTRGVSCHCLHLCSYYMMEECKFGKRCERNHQINDPQVTNVLTMYGVRVKRNLGELLHEVRIYNKKIKDELERDDPEHCGRPNLGGRAMSKRISSVPNLSHEQQLTLPPEHDETGERARKRPRNISESSCTSKIDEICLFNLEEKCHYGENCRQLHSSVPYLWRLAPTEDRVGENGVLNWKSLPSDSNQRLQKAYSQPQVTDCIIIDENGDEIKVDFHIMIAENRTTRQQYYRVQHLVTPSSRALIWNSPGARRHHDCSLASVWLWYWKNKDGIWQEFGMEKNDRKLPVSSPMVEEQYIHEQSETFQFGDFLLDFGKRRLKNVISNHTYKVRRRPVWNYDMETDSTERPWSYSDLCDKEEGKDSEARAIPKKEGNARGNHVSVPDVPVDKILSPIYADSQKFLMIKRRFANTLGVACTVLDIYKVFNPRLEDRYKRTRKRMEKQSSHRNGRMEPLMLYYGTSTDEEATAVYISGLELCTSNGAAAPVKRGYLHVNASRANRDIRNGSKKERHMFVMKCLVGDQFQSLDSDPPSDSGKKKHDRRYICHVDDVYEPKTFLVSSPSQVCPVYLITYQVA